MLGTILKYHSSIQFQNKSARYVTYTILALFIPLIRMYNHINEEHIPVFDHFITEIRRSVITVVQFAFLTAAEM